VGLLAVAACFPRPCAVTPLAAGVRSVHARASWASVAPAPDGAFAYVLTACDVCNSAPAFGVYVIDTVTNSVVATVGLPGTNVRPIDIAITPNGAFAYATAFASIFVIDTATNTVPTTIPANNSRGIAITPNGAFAYVTSAFPDKVSVLDTATNTFTTTIPVSRPNRVAITPDGSPAYVTQIFPASAVTAIDTTSNTTTATIATGEAFGAAITPDSASAYVALGTANAVSVIDTATNSIVATVPVGINAYDVAIVTPPPAPSGPTSPDQCKNGGWMTFTNPTFKNQGDCVSYVNHLP